MEALVISIVGGACACGLSWTALTGLAQWHPPTDYPVHFQVEPQPSLIVIAFLVSIAAGVVFGVMPLRQIFKADPNDAIKSGNSTTSTSAGRRWALRDLLLAAQIALCCITVTAAFVSLRGLSKALTTEIGIQPKNATLTKFGLSEVAYSNVAAEQLQRQLQDKLSHLPGVEAVGYGSDTPLADTVTTPVFAQQTTDYRPSNQAFETFYYDVSPGYFAAAGTPLIAGREVRFTDTAKTPPVAIVNKQFVRSMFHLDEGHITDGVGRYFKNHDGVPIQIVGMVPDGKYFLVNEDPQEVVFFSILQQPSMKTSVVVRLRPDAPAIAVADMSTTVRKTIHDLDPGIAIRSSGTWTSQLAFSFFPAQVATVSLGLFGAFGLMLSIAGTFGLASYTVSKRMRELSIRVALGARGKQILSAALGRMFTLMSTGAVIGLTLGMATSKLLSHVVFQASAQDPLVIVAVTFTILLTGLLSVAGPVRRALKIDPANLLREQ
jgi:predicted permease